MITLLCSKQSPTAEMSEQLGHPLRSNGPDGATLIAVAAVIMRPGRDMPPRREVMAALIHDPGLVDQLGLVSDVAAVAGFAVENERLHAQARVHLIEAEVSTPDNMDKGGQTNHKDIERGDRRV